MVADGVCTGPPILVYTHYYPPPDNRRNDTNLDLGRITLCFYPQQYRDAHLSIIRIGVDAFLRLWNLPMSWGWPARDYVNWWPHQAITISFLRTMASEAKREIEYQQALRGAAAVAQHLSWTKSYEPQSWKRCLEDPDSH
jgi:hypothetical protein